MAPNSYKVPRAQWVKWSQADRSVFNEVYCTMAYNQNLFLHPKQEPAELEYWATTAWNAAWIAANASRDAR